jgi:hypothetical protein
MATLSKEEPSGGGRDKEPEIKREIEDAHAN